MTDLTMRGPKLLRHLTCDWLKAEVPGRFPVLRQAWQLDEEQLPLPVRYDPHPPRALDEFPIVAVVSGQRTSRPSGDRSALGEAQWTVETPMRVFGWVRAREYAPTADLRDDFISALEVCVKAVPTMRGVGGGNVVILSTTVVTDFSDVEAVKGDRHIAGGYVGFTIRATETLSDSLAYPVVQPGRTVSSVTVQGAVLPTADALSARRAR